MLGLAHPDAGAARGNNFWYVRSATNLTDGGSAAWVSTTDCASPWDRVELWPNSSVTLSAWLNTGRGGALEAEALMESGAGTEQGVRFPNWQTIMATFTFNNPARCIHQDDLDAINVIYPTCANAVRVPQCDLPRSYLGLVRLASFAGLPIIVILVLMIAAHEIALRCHYASRERLKAAHPEEWRENEVELQVEALRARRASSVYGSGGTLHTPRATPATALPPSLGLVSAVSFVGTPAGVLVRRRSSISPTLATGAMRRETTSRRQAEATPIASQRAAPPGGCTDVEGGTAERDEACQAVECDAQRTSVRAIRRLSLGRPFATPAAVQPPPGAVPVVLTPTAPPQRTAQLLPPLPGATHAHARARLDAAVMQSDAALARLADSAAASPRCGSPVAM